MVGGREGDLHFGQIAHAEIGGLPGANPVPFLEHGGDLRDGGLNVLG